MVAAAYGAHFGGCSNAGAGGFVQQQLGRSGSSIGGDSSKADARSQRHSGHNASLSRDFVGAEDVQFRPQASREAAPQAAPSSHAQEAAAPSAAKTAATPSEAGGASSQKEAGSQAAPAADSQTSSALYVEAAREAAPKADGAEDRSRVGSRDVRAAP